MAMENDLVRAAGHAWRLPYTAQELAAIRAATDRLARELVPFPAQEAAAIVAAHEKLMQDLGALLFPHGGYGHVVPKRTRKTSLPPWPAGGNDFY